MRNKLKTTSFWLGVSGAIVVLLNSISEVFGIAISSSKVQDIIMSICAVLICAGFVTKKKEDGANQSKDELLKDVIKSNEKTDEEK